MAAGRITAILGGVLVLALGAGLLTEAAMAKGHHGGIFDDVLVRPTPSATPSATPTPTPTRTPTPSATPKPTATPVVRTAVTNGFVRMRAGKSTNTAILFELNGGTVVTLLPEVTPEWQQVQYGGKVGYIYRSYLTYR